MDETGQSAYISRENIRSQQYEYNKLSQYLGYERVNKMIIEAHILPKGVHSEIYHIMDIVKLGPIDYESYINELITYRDSIGYELGYHILNDTIKNITNIREKYDNCADNDEYKMYENIFDRYVYIRTDIFKKKQARWSTIGSKNTKTVTITENFKHPEKYNLKIGQEFESWKELSEFISKPNKTIATWKNKGWIQ